MAYEIPQQLEYKEKIIFGLTFKQLGWALFLLPFGILIFFKTGWSLTIRIIGIVFISALASGFMFLNFTYHIRSIVSWYRCRDIKEKDKLRAFVGVKKIANDTIITTDNRVLALLKVEPINFAIKPQGAQEAITASFQKFLNSLDFPLQIMMSTESLSLTDYFKELERKVKEQSSFKELFTKYKEHLEHTLAQDKVINRSFYLVIQQTYDLGIQIEVCQKKLETLGLKSTRVPTEMLKQLLQKFFIVSAKKSFVPKRIQNFPSHLKLNKIFTKVLHAHGYPRNVDMGFLDKIVSLQGDFDISLHIEPYDIETMMITLNKELQKQRADLYSAQTKGILNPSLEIKYTDTKAILENLQKGKEKLFNVSLYIQCRAPNKKELDMLVRRVETELNSLLIIPQTPQFRMLQGMQSCAPLAKNKLQMRRNVPTEALSAFFPFTSSFLQADTTGIWLGLNKNNIPIIKDIFKLSNPNGLCLASSGSGKSYMAKLLIARHLLHGTKVMVIDPQGEYTSLVSRFNGQHIDLGIDSETIINPLDLMGHEYREKRLALMDLMPIMLGELSETQKAFIDRALTKAYEGRGINHNPSTWNRDPPILEDVVQILEGMEKKASPMEKSTIQSLINRLSLYVEGVFSFLNKHTKINFDNRFVCFDIGSLPKQVKPVVMFLVLDYVYMKMKKDLERKLLVVDEAWSLLGRTEDASYIFEIVKTCRKFNLALFLINQEVEGMLASDAGKSVLANSAYTILMRQKPAVIKNIQETFYLSNSERIFLLTAAVGEGILLMDDEHSEIKIVASDEEHKYITTKPDEILEQEEQSTIKKQPRTSTVKVASEAKPKRQLSVRIKVDPDKLFYKHRSLSLHEVEYLLTKKYRESRQLNIHGKKELYLLKPRFNETIEHFFLTYDIANYLKTLADNVELYQTTKPDIVFSIKGKKYAVEVETGSIYETNKKQLYEKVQQVKKEYGDNWFFVVTNYRLGSVYSSLGKTFTRKNFVKQFSKWIKKH